MAVTGTPRRRDVQIQHPDEDQIAHGIANLATAQSSTHQVALDILRTVRDFEKSLERKDAEIALLERRLTVLRASTAYRVAARAARTLRAAQQPFRRAPTPRSETPEEQPSASAPTAKRRILDGQPVRSFSLSVDCAGAQEIQIAVEAMSSSRVERAALVSVRFLDAAGTICLPTGSHAIHPVLGEYTYLEDGFEEPAKTIDRVAVPEGAVSATVQGHQWKSTTETVVTSASAVAILPDECSDLDAAARPPADLSLEGFLDAGGESPVIVIYSTAPPVGHETLSLRPNRLAREYADVGIQVVFMPFGRLKDYVVNPHPGIHQVERTGLARVLRALADRPERQRVFVCSSFPDVAAVAAIDLAAANGIRTVYEVRDDMEEFNRVGYSKWYSPLLEARAAHRADVVAAVSPRLAAKMDLSRGLRPASVVVPNGVTRDLADKAEHLRTLACWEERLKRRRVGYVGHLTPQWFDWPTLITAARQLPDVEFEIIGHGAPESLELPENIVLLGPRTHDECLELAASWQIGLIPFKESILTHAVDPNKLYEYLAFGLRTVSAPMASVDTSPSTLVYGRGKALEEALSLLLDLPMNATELADMDAFVASSLWRVRAEEMRELMGVRL